MPNLPRNLLILAAILALIASIIILYSSSLITQTTVNEDGTEETVVSQQSWYQVQGDWGVITVLIFAIVYVLPYYLSSKDLLAPAAFFAILALVLTWLAGFSIGFYYLPAAGALFLSYIALGVGKLGQT
jgi:cell division protein FtsW (lipid II flippase)